MRFVSRRNFEWIVYALPVCLLILLVYLPATLFPYINYDDPFYVFENSVVKAGLNGEALRYALTTFDGFYQPVTWLSHCLDSSLFGLASHGRHFVNILIHLFNAILVLRIAGTLSNDMHIGLLCASIFAIHPINIESVVWISERKGLLATLFLLMSLACYVKYLTIGGRVFVFAFLFFYAFSLLSKPSALAAPILFSFTKLVIDDLRAGPYQPALRFYRRYFDLPIAITTIMSCVMAVITVYAENRVGALRLHDSIPLDLRLSTAITNLGRYFYVLLFPTDLSLIYPWRITTLEETALATLFLIAGASACYFVSSHSRRVVFGPFLVMLCLLLPVSGIVQIGEHLWANRYLYLPFSVFAVVISFSLRSLRQSKVCSLCIRVGIVYSIALAAITRVSLPAWRSDIAIFSNAYNVTDNNYVAANFLGYSCLTNKQFRLSEIYLNQAIAAKPDLSQAHFNLANLHFQTGDINKALQRLTVYFSISRGDDTAAVLLNKCLTQAADDDPNANLAINAFISATGHSFPAKLASPMLTETYPQTNGSVNLEINR